MKLRDCIITILETFNGDNAGCIINYIHSNTTSKIRKQIFHDRWKYTKLYYHIYSKIGFDITFERNDVTEWVLRKTICDMFLKQSCGTQYTKNVLSHEERRLIKFIHENFGFTIPESIQCIIKTIYFKMDCVICRKQTQKIYDSICVVCNQKIENIYTT